MSSDSLFLFADHIYRFLAYIHGNKDVYDVVFRGAVTDETEIFFNTNTPHVGYPKDTVKVYTPGGGFIKNIQGLHNYR